MTKYKTYGEMKGIKVSVIIVSDAKNFDYDDMTGRFIKSIIKDYPSVEIICVEKQKHYNIDYYKLLRDNDKFINQDKEFNYNNELNKGIEKANGDYVWLVNNDMLIHEENTIQRIIDSMEEHHLDVASAIGDDTALIKDKLDWDVIRGYKVRESIFGFNMMVRKDKLTFKLNTDMKFYYSDDVFMDQCIEHGLIVASLPQIYIEHFESVSLKGKSRDIQIDYTQGDHNRYKKRKQ